MSEPAASNPAPPPTSASAAAPAPGAASPAPSSTSAAPPAAPTPGKDAASTSAESTRSPKATNGLIAWLLLAASLAGLVGVGLSLHRSTQRVTSLERDLTATRAQATLLTRERDEATKRVAELLDEKQRLSGELQETSAQKEATKAELDRTRAELATKLAGEIKQGEVVLRLRSGDLIVDVSDKILFDTGKAEVNAHGQKVLRQVAASIIRMPKRVFQVSGHTDAARVKSADVREHYPTNWELSTARATNVVRFLQEKCGIPGPRLVASGYAEHQPIASNATEKGKQRNRRIEIALLKEVPAE